MINSQLSTASVEHLLTELSLIQFVLDHEVAGCDRVSLLEITETPLHGIYF